MKLKPLVVANWKCNPTTLIEAKRLFNSAKRRLQKIKNIEVVICPPFIYLLNLKSENLNLKLGGQDCFWEEKGAFTSEISGQMLKDLGCHYVIVGHSERRRYFQETDEIINKKIKAAIATKLTPILCVGETAEEREKGETENVLKKQITLALENVSVANFQKSRLVVAYEPVWAIGSGNPCEAETAMSRGLLIRKIVAGLYSISLSRTLRILYGGSVNSKNAAGYLKEAKMQGLLVGGASLDAGEFIQIVKAAQSP